MTDDKDVLRVPVKKVSVRQVVCRNCGRVAGIETTLQAGVCKGGCKNTTEELQDLMRLPRNARRRRRRLVRMARAQAQLEGDN